MSKVTISRHMMATLPPWPLPGRCRSGLVATSTQLAEVEAGAAFANGKSQLLACGVVGLRQAAGAVAT